MRTYVYIFEYKSVFFINGRSLLALVHIDLYYAHNEEHTIQFPFFSILSRNYVAYAKFLLISSIQCIYHMSFNSCLLTVRFEIGPVVEKLQRSKTDGSEKITWEKINLPRLTIIINFEKVFVTYWELLFLPQDIWCGNHKVNDKSFTIWKLLILWITSTW